MNTIIKMKFPLPYLIPIKISNPVSIKMDNVEFIFEFSEEEVFQKRINIEEKYNKTIVEVELQMESNADSEFSENVIVQELVNLCLFNINQLLNALRAQSEIMHIQPITITDLPEIIEVNYNNKKIPYVTNINKIYDENFLKIDDDCMQEAMNIFNSWNIFPSIKIPHSLFSSAKSNMLNRNYLLAIIELQTSFELFISSCMYIVLSSEGESEENIKVKLNKMPFRNKIEHFLSDKLLVDLSFEKNSYIMNWKKYLYDYRNNIIHSGLQFMHRDEALNSLRSYIEVYNYIGNLMLKNNYISSFEEAKPGVFNRNINDKEFISKALERITFKKDQGQNKKRRLTKLIRFTR